MITRWKAAAVALASSLLVLTACTNEDPGDAATPTESASEENPYTPGVFPSPDEGEPQPTDVFTVADFAEIRSLDPAVSISAGFSGGSALVAVYDQLVRWDASTEEYVPHLAEAVEANDDFTEWTVTLREDVQFSDGSPLDADAVVSSVERYVANRGYDMGVIGPIWGGIEKRDERTVVFKLTQSLGTFNAMLGQGMGMIVAPSAGEAEGFTPIGAGAFTLADYQPAEHLELNANPNYWDGEPPIKKLRFVWLGSDDTSKDAFVSGDVDSMLIRSPEHVATLRSEGQPGAVMMQNIFSALINNAEGRPGSYDKARQAMAAAIDPQVMIDRVYNGYGIPSKHLFSSASRWHSDTPAVEVDPEAAAALLEEAKSEGYDGTVTITALNQDEALALQAQLEAVGFEVEVDLLRTAADSIDRVFVRRDFDIALTSVPAMEEEPYQRIFANLHSESASNVSSYVDPEMDALIEELAAAGDDATRTEVIGRLEARYQEMAPNLTYYGMAPYFAWQENVHGVVATNNVMMAFDKAWRS